MKFYAGGEPFYSPFVLIKPNKWNILTYLKNSYPDYNFELTGGGIYSLFLILNSLKIKKNEYVLLPSYLCPTIIDLFKYLKINFIFFQVNEKLEIDIKNIDSLISKDCRALLFINYFGFQLSVDSINYLKSINQKGILLIQDLVQSFFPKFEIIGDYCFNSFRKFTFCDGSVIFKKNYENFNEGSINLKYSINKHIGRFLRYANYSTGIDLSNIFLRNFSIANKAYYRYEKNKINPFDKYLLSKIDLKKLNDILRNNFSYLLNEFKDYALFKSLPDDVVPIAFPIKIKNRDFIKSELSKRNIFCPVHWDYNSTLNLLNYKESLLLSKNILTIPLLNISSRNLFKIVDLLINYFKKYQC